MNPAPGRVGADIGWKSCSESEYFYQVLQKKDGSLWGLDVSDYASAGKSNYTPVTFRPIPLQKDVVAIGATGRSIMGVALTKEGEVWTWGKVLGKYAGAYPALQTGAEALGWKTTLFKGKPVVRKAPWLLPHTE
ncbi:MAG TPA: hypothetical protein VK530_06650 [Candidatus Acidoferrum sp.]|nr:hypothetical protein [Candidatus Acidoferrum sp.]